MAKVWRQIDLLLDIPDDALDDARPRVREFYKEILIKQGGAQPNGFIDNIDQAADYSAQDDQMALNGLITLALQEALAAHAPRIAQVETDVRPLPADYEPPA
ncbi:hypothetical protein [Pimelobacter sp. 30-1]|uniref:hypothetical protein n=1 Tax=Pimelobacter sp. 30-1 TaxID=2004991 RepID=UPI001C03CC60|nr:hypothetical protein [Pimelobacter sp. 30-1]MBU2698800.1 hypothetical protein [Pimelobacter sp. 30-1]